MITIQGNETEINVFKELARTGRLDSSVRCQTLYGNGTSETNIKLLGIDVAFKEVKENVNAAKTNITCTIKCDDGFTKSVAQVQKELEEVRAELQKRKRPW